MTEMINNLTATAAACDSMAMYGARPGEGEPDYRPAPDTDSLGDYLVELLGVIRSEFENSCFDDEMTKLSWQFVNALHRRQKDIERELDRNQMARRELCDQQDGSEIKSYELEKATNVGDKLYAKEQFYNELLGRVADEYERMTGSIFRPLSGSKMDFSGRTAAMMDSADFTAAREKARRNALGAEGPVVLFTGGQDFENYDFIFKKLDQVHAKYPDMVLVHTAQQKGADMIAAKWAKGKNVAQVAMRPNYSLGSRRGFVRNDDMLKLDHIVGVVVFPGGGIQKNLAQKARLKGYPVLVVEEGRG